MLEAAVFAPVWPEDFYEAVLDVRGFPAWAPGVRRFEVISGEGGAWMVSDWEVSFLGFGKTVRSVLEETESPYRLRWTYDGPVGGWGGCSIEEAEGGILASFRTELSPKDPLLAVLSQGAAARGAARTHLKRALSRLGRLVAGDEARVLVGSVPVKETLAGVPAGLGACAVLDRAAEPAARSTEIVGVRDYLAGAHHAHGLLVPVLRVASVGSASRAPVSSSV